MIKNILIIRFRRVGDSILSLALCHSLRLSFPQARIDYVLNSQIAPLCEGHPDVDRVIAFSPEEQGGWRYVRRVAEVVQSCHYDVIIDMQSKPKTLLFPLLSLNTKYRIGRRKTYTRWSFNKRVGRIIGESMLNRNDHFLEPLEAEAPIVYSHDFKLYPTDEERRLYRQYMLSKGIDMTRPIVLVAVTTRILGKQWPEERMTCLLQRMLDTTDAQLVFNYAGEVETRQARDYYERLGRNGRVFIDVEARGLRELMALTSLCTFFFGNEGGPRHLSQALDIPSFAIFPVGVSIGEWLPMRGSRYNGIAGDDQVLTVDAVWSGLQPMLAEYVK